MSGEAARDLTKLFSTQPDKPDRPDRPDRPDKPDKLFKGYYQNARPDPLIS
jgi:hypothetical protein